MLEVIIKYRLRNEGSGDNVYRIKPFYRKALIDMQQAVNNNHTLNNTCDMARFVTAKYVNPTSNDRIMPLFLKTKWEIEYQKYYLNPMIRR